MILPFFLSLSIAASPSCKKNSDSATVVNNNPTTPTTREWLFDSTITWSDEFDISGAPDPAKWGYDIGGNGWGNNELEYYTNGSNVNVEDGILKITAKKENYAGSNYTSTRLNTKGKADWLYGRFEIKAKLPKGRGTWPAIWMLPSDNAYGGWPNSGEIDIMEHVGFDLNTVHFTLHAQNFYGGNGKGGQTYIASATDNFHVYRLDWAPYGIRGYCDGIKIFEYSNPQNGSGSWPFDKKFHMLLNIAVGGNWGGQQGVDPNAFPAVMEIDYVRAYKFIT